MRVKRNQVTIVRSTRSRPTIILTATGTYSWFLDPLASLRVTVIWSVTYTTEFESFTQRKFVGNTSTTGTALVLTSHPSLPLDRWRYQCKGENGVGDDIRMRMRMTRMVMTRIWVDIECRWQLKRSRQLRNMIVRTSVPTGWERMILLFKCMVWFISVILNRFDKQKTAHKIDKAKERKFQVKNLPI